MAKKSPEIKYIDSMIKHLMSELKLYTNLDKKRLSFVETLITRSIYAILNTLVK
jgi:hypothetical protein